MKKINLFCFPYAGGSSVVYNHWKKFLDPNIELKPVELAGRGRRISESFYEDLPDLIEDVFQQLQQEILYFPYALFGHSMGGLISYELAQKISNSNLPSPRHIFFSGKSAPHVKRPDEKKYHLLNDNDFKNEVIKLGGTPPEFFEHPELRDLLLPLLKNDFKIAETEICNGKIHPLDTNITVFLGKQEDLTPEQCDGWREHTTQLCSIHYFTGGHFFLQNEKKQLIRFINNTLIGDVY